MNRLQTALKNATVNGVIQLAAAIKIARQFDEDEETSLSLISQCKSQVGMMLGEDLRAHEAKLKGAFFNSKEFHFERPVGEQ
ncbi:hypothetical protein [Pedobacter gandavensis]|uniref:Uncharacterized protein n=1 Tax=Pedobacter gandavensis TaxID=2679963 RepID=A0ABR6EU53_9SPHI|nr:hypothetical protein [Pedobacter gandavensis]MBB2148804.1 hypothetical protein [Pedobacter gandavensis]